MKKTLFFLLAVWCFAACKDQPVAPPANLIAEDKMIDIIHDLTVLEAMRSQYQMGKPDLAINPKEYVFKKYQIDSLQFAKSNHYYAADIANYKKMYDKVTQRIQEEQVQADALAKKSSSSEPINNKPADPDAPQVK